MLPLKSSLPRRGGRAEINKADCDKGHRKRHLKCPEE